MLPFTLTERKRVPARIIPEGGQGHSSAPSHPASSECPHYREIDEDLLLTGHPLIRKKVNTWKGMVVMSGRGQREAA
ncbi:hypothetical protein [Methanoregula formicica]|uniref:hypothetical protein n=1 Tax=Methanoregula formicica TaxID=882104 RepID=UPI0011D25E89|nr:hypothetical protein [Methanoregula formicica]